ncbi:secreted protein [Melampsora americana]|nr:secreted protein [Melampsora americana]
MSSFRTITFVALIFTIRFQSIFTAPSPSRISSSSHDSEIVKRVVQAHHGVSGKAENTVGRKHVSRRSPFHPDVLMARSNTGPLATVTQLMNAASAVDGDKKSIHDSLTSLQSNKQMRESNEFQKEISEKLKQWQKHANTIPTLTNIHNSLSYFGRDKGMANLDKSNEMEVTLKNTINSMKNSMSDVNLMVYQVPALGPTLGPIVYQIKCILDDILNGSENTADALLTKLGIGKNLDLCSLMSSMSEFC